MKLPGLDADKAVWLKHSFWILTGFPDAAPWKIGLGDNNRVNFVEFASRINCLNINKYI